MKSRSKKQNKQKNGDAHVKRDGLKRSNKPKLPDDYVPPPELERYLELCISVFERMEKDGFPWEKPKSQSVAARESIK